MIQKIELHNFGPLSSIKWDSLGGVNIVIGKNGSGKTFILKALYAAARSLEAYRRGDDKRALGEILRDKLYWTFQPEQIGDLVARNADGSLILRLVIDGNQLSCCFGKDAARQIEDVEFEGRGRAENSIFIPAKEVLTLFHVILKSREQDQAFGFDDTYLDLARALRSSARQERLPDQIAEARRALAEILEGGAIFDDEANRWVFMSGRHGKFPIGVAAEGIKKVAILDALLASGYLTCGSIIFIDEPEAALHPQAVSKFMEIVCALSKAGMQFFMATHSYFVIKKLYLMAIKENAAVNVLSIGDDAKADTYNLQDGLPENPIVEESVRLYEEEVGVGFNA